MDACPASDLPPGVSATRVPEWLLPDESPAQRELYRPDLLLIPRLTNEMLSLLHFATTFSAVSALARSSVLHTSRKRGRPSGLRGAAYALVAAPMLRELHGPATTMVAAVP